jgi:hypothetical protein
VSNTLNISELLNLVGLSTGVVLYAMLLAMVVRAGRASGRAQPLDPLLLATAILGLVWNLCALPIYELPKVGFEGPFPYLAALGFGALGFLPAVVVHSVLRRERQHVRGTQDRGLAAIAYGVSTIALLLHLAGARSSTAVPSSLGMRLLTYTFIALIVPLAAVTRGQAGARRALWAAALATFAVSALHLSQLHKGDASWPVELVGHHASLPLAFAILYQDYPFALADLFLRRALMLFALVALPFSALVVFGVRSDAFAAFVKAEPGQVAILVVLWIVTALLYPSIRRGSAWFVDAIVLHRPDYGSLRAAIARNAQRLDDVPALLTSVCDLLRPALNSRAVSWHAVPLRRVDEAIGSAVVTGTAAADIGRTRPPADRGEHTDGETPVAAVRVVTSEDPGYLIAIGHLTGGRRLLSDDLATLEAIAVIVARRIDGIRLSNERYDRETREREMRRLATEAELRALRAQVNPHFLFNALTTIGYLIQTAPPRALETLLRLTALLRGVLRSEGEFTTLGRELDIIESCLDIERALFEHRLGATIVVPSRLRHIQLPPLVLQPIVENAVKHGIARKQAGGEITIRARISDDGQPRCLSVMVRDTGAGATAAALERGREAGLGLRNVERRLNYQYGPAASLSIETSPLAGTVVEIRVPLDRSVSTPEEGSVVM